METTNVSPNSKHYRNFCGKMPGVLYISMVYIRRGGTAHSNEIDVSLSHLIRATCESISEQLLKEF